MNIEIKNNNHNSNKLIYQISDVSSNHEIEFNSLFYRYVYF